MYIHNIHIYIYIIDAYICTYAFSFILLSVHHYILTPSRLHWKNWKKNDPPLLCVCIRTCWLVHPTNRAYILSCHILHMYTKLQSLCFFRCFKWKIATSIIQAYIYAKLMSLCMHIISHMYCSLPFSTYLAGQAIN